MFITIDETKQNGLYDVIKNHDFKAYMGFTSKYRGFEIPNLDKDVKMAVLKKLSIANWRDVPIFTEFWKWFKKNHGTILSQQICKYMFPTDEKTRQYMINCMRNNQQHEWWNHIKARVYKQWCSIITEMQAVFSVLTGANDLQLDWKILASAKLDAAGIDFVIVQNTTNVATPIQIKKDSFQKQINHKKNNDENFIRYPLTKKARKLIEEVLNKNFIIEDTLLVKYGLAKSGVQAYEYLGQFENNFVYFSPEKFAKALQTVIQEKPMASAQNDSNYKVECII